MSGEVTNFKYDLVIKDVNYVNFTKKGEIKIEKNKTICVKDGLIKGIIDSKKDVESEYTINAEGRLAIPGLINTHNHFYSTFARGISLRGESPRNFLEILEKLWWWLDKGLIKEDIYWSTMPILIEAIKNGTTTIFDHHSSPMAIKGSLNEIARAVREAGLRADLCYEVSDRDGEEIKKKGIEENYNFIIDTKVKDNDQIKAHFGLHACFTLEEETLKEVAKLSKELETGIHIHLAEDLIDQQLSKKRYLKGVIDRLVDLELLNRKTILAHCVYINEREMDIIKERECFVAHNPESNMGNAVGIADIPTMVRKNLRVGLGTDGCGTRMFNGIRLLLNLQKIRLLDPQAMDYSSVIKIAFIEPAKLASEAFGLKLGYIEEGAGADIVIMDYYPPTPMDGKNFVGHLLFGISDSIVWATICRGKLLYYQGRLMHLDEREINQEAEAFAKNLWKRLGVI